MFGPYGNARDSQGTINTAKGFTGQYNDSLTGLDYYQSRYYDQVAGVFLSADVSQGNGSGANPYGYVSDNPETKNDPSGQIGLPPVTTQPPATSNPLTWPKLQIPPEEPAPVEMCFLLCPTLGVVGVVGIATVLAIGLFFLTSPAEHLYDPQRPVVIAAYLTRSSEEFYGSNGPTQLTYQPHSSPPQTQTGSGGQGVIPPLPVAATGGYCSFTADTQVATAHGEQAIGKLHIGDKVLAYNPKTHKMELQPILQVWRHNDHNLIDLTIMTTTVSHHDRSTTPKSEVVHATSEHPFLTMEQGFVPAGKIKDGTHILRADGSVGVVSSKMVVSGTRVMYNLEVAQDHTFTVGDGQWVVHNACRADKLRAALNNVGRVVQNGQDPHHIIPCALENHPLVQDAGPGFDINAEYNGRPLWNYRYKANALAANEPYHANAPGYARLAEGLMNDEYLRLVNSNALSPGNAYDALMYVINVLNSAIDFQGYMGVLSGNACALPGI